MNLTNLWDRAIKHSLFNRSVDRAPGAMRRAVRPFGQPRSAPPQPCPVRRDPRGCSSPFPRRASLWRLRPRENAATRLRGARACLALLAAAALPRLAALLLVLAASLAAAENAAAQTVTLVSNANQGLDTSSTVGGDRAQAFTTGAVAATLSSVEIISEDSQGDDATVSLCTVVDNLPPSSCTALTAPSSFAAGTLVFTAPANTTLAANTTYSLLVTSPGSDDLVLDVTRSGAEDAGGTPGWSIANNFHHFPRGAAMWTPHTMRALRITIKDASANNAPTVANPLHDRTATAGSAFSYAFPDNTFADVDAGDTLTYTATKSDDSELPAWLGFAAATRTFSGTPQAADVGTVSVKVTASDGTDSVSDTFDIVVNVAGTNNAPMVANAIPDQTATVGTVFNYAFPANTFNDTDAGDTLVYTATKSNNSALPSWLSFAPATRTFSGTAADAGTVSVKVTASDSTDSVSDTFDIVVSANTAPTAADKTVTTAQDTNYTFTPFDFDFGYVDADDDPLVSVLIVTVPAAGALALNGVAVMASRTVTWAEISDGHLKFEPATGESGGPYTNFTFKVNDGTDDSVSAYTMTIDVMIVSAPDAPTGLTATASGQAWIELAWTAPVHAGGRAITGYTIEVSPDGSTWSDLVAATASTATTYVHKGLSAGATRHYRVSAINSAMNVVRTSDSSGSDHATTRTDEQLVSNFNYLGAADNIHLTVQNVVGIFTTGSREAKLNSIELKLGKFNYRSVAPALKLYTLNLDNSGRATLGTEVATLDTPSTSLTLNSFRTFSYQAPSGTSLTASQAYMFVLEPPSTGIVLVETTTDPSEDDVKADGWTIDGSGDGSSPFAIGPRREIVFRVNGTLVSTTTATNAPMVATEIPDRTATAGAAFSYAFPAHTFADTDAGDTLTYTATKSDDSELPSWLGFAAATRTFSGTPQAADVGTVSVKVTASDGSDSVSDTFDIVVSAAANTAATGEPTISGTAQVGETLTAVTTGITDADGLTSATYTYQWIRVDADGTSNEAEISGEIAATYTLADDDEGKKIKVKLSFTDDLNGEEERTSGAYPTSGTVQASSTPVSAVLISNSAQASSNTATNNPLATAFTTGNNPAGYGLTSVDIYTSAQSGSPNPLVQIVRNSAGDQPGIIHATLINPATVTNNAANTFNAPPNTTLTANTVYWLVVSNAAADNGQGFRVKTGSETADTGAAMGWSIGTALRTPDIRTAWNDSSVLVIFAVKGTTATTTTANTAPGAPTGLAATANGQSRIDLAWTAPANTGGSAITGYKIEVSPDGSSSSWTDLVANTESTATTYTHTGLNAATTRHYRVSAINAGGSTSVASNIDDATTEEATTDEASTTTPTASGQRSSPSTPPPPPDDVVGYLENPGAESFQSGIGVISGWTCDAEAVEIVLNGVPQEAAYGTERLDTAGVCSDTDNGFGLLFNWNLLGDGEHEVVALVDGVELDRATVTVTTLGTEFLRDVTGTCTAADFPTGDEAVTLAWQQTQQNFVLVDGMPPTGANRAGTPGMGYLENPGPNSFQSGIGVLSGWVCEGDEVVIELNGEPQPAAYGTERLDTLGACGDTANGFGLLFNWNLLGDGAHTVVALVDGMELGRATVQVTTLGVEFLRDVEGECVVEDFPMLGETVLLEWQQNSQNFVITDVE